VKPEFKEYFFSSSGEVYVKPKQVDYSKGASGMNFQDFSLLNPFSRVTVVARENLPFSTQRGEATINQEDVFPQNQALTEPKVTNQNPPESFS